MQWIKKPLSYLIGQKAEQQACDYLVAQGMRLIRKNFRCRSGEIDLIMMDEDEWVFVEVKYRSKKEFGLAMEYFHQHKRKKFERAMQQFLYEQRLNPAMVAHRIDLLAIDDEEIQWLKSV